MVKTEPQQKKKYNNKKTIWLLDKVLNTIADNITNYIIDKINNYNKKKLKDINLFKY